MTGRRGPLLVVGDALLDRDIVGSASRLCPDAPVPILDVEEEHSRPGGAGLAALLGAMDGHEVVLVTALSDDAAGAQLRDHLEGRVRIVSTGLPGGTPEKVRIRAGDQSLVRLDRGGAGHPDPVSEAMLEAVHGAGAVLVSDYGRGLTADPWLREVLAARARTVPVVWDPHPRGSAPVPGLRLVTPNAAEAELFDPAPSGSPADLSRLTARANRLRERWQSTAVVLTLGGQGALLSFGAASPMRIPAATVVAGDTCGAGDRFAAAVAGSLLDGALVSDAVQAAVAACTAFVAAGAASSVHPVEPAPSLAAAPDAQQLIAQIRAGGGTVVATGGCFDLLHAGHLATLRAARALGDALVVCLNSDASVRRLKGADRPLVGARDRAALLSALDCVDAVAVFDDDTPAALLAHLRPHIWVKGGDYADGSMPEADLVRSWGGQAVVVPYLQGRSSTGLVNAARSGGQLAKGPS